MENQMENPTEDATFKSYGDLLVFFRTFRACAPGLSSGCLEFLCDSFVHFLFLLDVIERDLANTKLTDEQKLNSISKSMDWNLSYYNKNLNESEE